MFKLLSLLIELICNIFRYAFYILCIIPYFAVCLIGLLLPYIIWSGMFSLLTEHIFKFVLLIVPALLGSAFGLFIGGGLANDVIFDGFGKKTPSNKKKTSETKESKLKDSIPSILMIAIIIAEIGVAYIYPASTVKDRYFERGGGNGYSSGNEFSENTNNSNDREVRFWEKIHFGKNHSSAWDNFEEKNRIGDYYQSIAADYSPLTEAGNYGGGISLKANENLYFSFPALSKSEISNRDKCSGMMGTTKELFGYKDDITLGQLKDDLGLTSETDFDGNLLYKKTAPSGYYYVTIMSENIKNDSGTVTLDTWISIVSRDREIIPYGSLTSDQNATRETVYFVQGGKRYHRDPTCSTLHDSDEIYECYLDEVPDGRNACDVCY